MDKFLLNGVLCPGLESGVVSLLIFEGPESRVREKIIKITLLNKILFSTIYKFCKDQESVFFLFKVVRAFGKAS